MQQSMVHRKYHGKTCYLLRNIDVGIQELAGLGYHVNDMLTMQNQVTVDDVMWKSHKTITQINRTNESHKQIAENKMMSCPRMEMTNDTFGCSRATQVHVEDLRLVNLTEICPSPRGERFKATC